MEVSWVTICSILGGAGNFLGIGWLGVTCKLGEIEVAISDVEEATESGLNECITIVKEFEGGETCKY